MRKFWCVIALVKLEQTVPMLMAMMTMMMTVMIIRWSNEARQSARAGLAAPSLSAGPQVAVLIIIIITMDQDYDGQDDNHYFGGLNGMG